MLRTEVDEAAAAVRGDRAASLANADDDIDNIVIIVLSPWDHALINNTPLLFDVCELGVVVTLGGACILFALLLGEATQAR